MPVTPLPPDNTGRLFINYRTGSSGSSREHTFQIRCVSLAVASSDGLQLAYDVLNAWGADGFREGWQVIGASFALEGSNVRLPVDLTSDLESFVGTYAGAYNARFEAVEISFQGRSSTSGRKVDLSLYPAASDSLNTFRAPVGPSGEGLRAARVVNVLNGVDGLLPGVGVAIDNTVPLWKPYVNYNYNSHWERQLRG